MKELEKQYNKNVKNPANFSIHRPSYMAGGRAALEWALRVMEKDREQGWPIKASKITIRKELKE